MAKDSLTRDYSLLIGGYLQGFFAKAGGGEGGIDLDLDCDDTRVNGKYRGYDFSVYFSRVDSNLNFNFLVSYPKGKSLEIILNDQKPNSPTKSIKDIRYDKIENPKDKVTYLKISCFVIEPKDRFQNLNYLFNEIWLNILRNPFIKMMNSKQ